jgi:hypothetical protein
MLAFLRASAWGAALALSLAAHGAFTTQQDAPGQSYFGNVNYADGLFTPVESLSSLSDNAFTTMGHPFFPRYSVRIKKSQFCDKTVK